MLRRSGNLFWVLALVLWASGPAALAEEPPADHYSWFDGEGKLLAEAVVLGAAWDGDRDDPWTRFVVQTPAGRLTIAQYFDPHPVTFRYRAEAPEAGWFGEITLRLRTQEYIGLDETSKIMEVLDEPGGIRDVVFETSDGFRHETELATDELAEDAILEHLSQIDPASLPAEGPPARSAEALQFLDLVFELQPRLASAWHPVVKVSAAYAEAFQAEPGKDGTATARSSEADSADGISRWTFRKTLVSAQQAEEIARNLRSADPAL